MAASKLVYKIVGKLTTNKSAILAYLHLGYVKWDSLISRLQSLAATPAQDFEDEQIWTFLVAAGYALGADAGVQRLASLLTGDDSGSMLDHGKIWMEVLPLPTRAKEGSTHVDLAVGTILPRASTKSGINLTRDEKTWVCFSEMKWCSDLSPDVRHDRHRNQLARLVENATLFGAPGSRAEKVFVTLVAPAAFIERQPPSRMYRYKFDEYSASGPVGLASELRACSMRWCKRLGGREPADLDVRLDSLVLRQVSYEALFAGLGPWPMTELLQKFEGHFNGTNP